MFTSIFSSSPQSTTQKRKGKIYKENGCWQFKAEAKHLGDLKKQVLLDVVVHRLVGQITKPLGCWILVTEKDVCTKAPQVDSVSTITRFPFSSRSVKHELGCARTCMMRIVNFSFKREFGACISQKKKKIQKRIQKNPISTRINTSKSKSLRRECGVHASWSAEKKTHLHVCFH